VNASPSAVNLLVTARARAGGEPELLAWQARFQRDVLATPGCRSCESYPPAPPDQLESVTVVRFDSVDAMRTWRRSETSRQLVADAVPLVEGGVVAQIPGGAANEYYVQNSATEVIVTDVKAGKEDEFRSWADRIERVQNTFPGFYGSYTQPPSATQTGWTTLIRFDTVEHLNGWLESPQRASLIKESEGLVDRVTLHRVDSAFPGWTPTDPSTGKAPPEWKTPLLVLLGLFPIIMLELKFLTPALHALNPALSTFFGNALSVLLLTWPVMPFIMWAFKGWMFPDKQPAWVETAGPAAIAAIYALELIAFWRLL
jgi:antibiotic biosynthesis monooxygenase (ABM) superfamily enzyme